MSTIIRAIGLALLIVAGSLALALPASPQSRGTQGSDAVEAIFKEIEKQIIREFFGQETDDTAARGGGNKKAKGGGKGGGKGAKSGGKGAKGEGLPPGLAKREQLPPGLERQLVKNGTLPPGIAKRALPPGLSARLGPVPAGTERVIVGGDVALVEVATGVILDILKDVLSN